MTEARTVDFVLNAVLSAVLRVVPCVRWILSLVLLVHVMSCRSRPTQVEVLLASDVSPEQGLNVVVSYRLSRVTDGGTVRRLNFMSPGIAGRDFLPASFTLTPLDGEPRNQEVTLVLDATTRTFAGATLNWQRTARFQFIPQRPSVLRIYLSSQCAAPATGCRSVPPLQCTISTLCIESGQTCGNEGSCVPAEVVPQPADEDGAVSVDDVPTDIAAVDATRDAERDGDRGSDSGVVAMDAANDMDAADSASAEDAVSSMDAVDVASDDRPNVDVPTVDNPTPCGGPCPPRANSLGMCVLNTCQYGCNTNFADCDRSPMNGCEVDLSTQSNCGTCGNTCSAPTPLCANPGGGYRCTNGCQPGETQCGMTCANLMSDPSHCGVCGNRCPAGAMCAGGTCQCVVPLIRCGASCIDVQSDNNNCGGCGNVCDGGRTCSGGACRCPAGQNFCGGLCVASDSMHCGPGCLVCAGGMMCANNSCMCSMGTMNCNGTCTFLMNDPNNCGACGRVCGAMQRCSTGACTCNNAAQTACGPNCYDLQTDRDHCGSCVRACPAGNTCVGGACQCQMPNQMCAGRCTDTQTDVFHCGMCGIACPAGLVCSGGACGAGIAGDTCSTPINAGSGPVGLLGRTCGGAIERDALGNEIACGGVSSPDLFVQWTPDATRVWDIAVSPRMAGDPNFSLTLVNACAAGGQCFAGGSVRMMFVNGQDYFFAIRAVGANQCGGFRFTPM